MHLDTRCYAVDTWQGDQHAGFYTANVLDELRAHHDPRYGSFSTLIQGTFDDARGHFGDGTIEAFDPNSGKDLGKLTLHNGQTFAQQGLWGISFGNDVDNQPKNALFYAAGPSKSTGVFGRIDAAAN